MTDELENDGVKRTETHELVDRPSDATPKPSVVDVAVEKPETGLEEERVLSGEIGEIRKSVRKAVKYVLAAAGALIITTAGGSNPSSRPATAPMEGVEMVSASNQKIDYRPGMEEPAAEKSAPSTWQLFNMGHDNRTFNIDVKYPESLTYRVEDLSDPSNFKEITTVIEEAGEKVRAVIKLDKPVTEGVRYSVRLADNPDKKPEGLNADGIAPLPQNPLE